jgi:hypothetical protein
LGATTIQRLVDSIEAALFQLKASYNPEQVEEIAILIHETMSAPNRKFHTTEHVFDVMQTGGPHHVLAALFHDIVYYNVDRKLGEKIEEYLSPTVTVDGEFFKIRNKIPSSDKSVNMVMALFGFQPGVRLSLFNGMNEFLSALVVVRALEEILGFKDLMTIICCIEASIPFRSPDQEGKTCFHFLEIRVRNFCRERKLLIGDDEIADEMRIAVKFANQDVINFAEKETAKFLGNTWKLLPENSPNLSGHAIYSVKRYRVALEKMESFFSSINTNLIFHQYRGEPDDKTFQALCKQTVRNVELGRSYLRGRLLSTAVLEALSELTGGDAPVVMFLGGNTKGNIDSKYEFDDQIPYFEPQGGLDVDPDLIRLFDYDSVRGSLLDFRKSPLAAYFYSALGTKNLELALVQAKRMFAGEITPDQFLNYIGKPLVKPVAKACATMISTRKEKLLRWAA